MIYLAIISTSTFLLERRKKYQKKTKNMAISAWKLISQTCAELIDYIKNTLYSSDFVNRHKRSTKDFTRKSKLTFQTIFLFLGNFRKGSYQDDPDHYFKALFRLDVAIAFVSKMNFSLARKKINYSAFVELNRHLLELFDAHFKNIKTWCGFNLLAVDGTGQKLFKYKDIVSHFGVMKPGKVAACPMARISQLFMSANRTCSTW